jgi:hypothetical protein
MSDTASTAGAEQHTIARGATPGPGRGPDRRAPREGGSC